MELRPNVTRFELLKRSSKRKAGYVWVCMCMYVQVSVCTGVGIHVCVCVCVWSPNFSILTQKKIYFLNSEQTIINMPIYNLWPIDFIFIVLIYSLVSLLIICIIFICLLCFHVTFSKASTVVYSFTTAPCGSIPRANPSAHSRSSTNILN